jgi:hypothetical protein
MFHRATVGVDPLTPRGIRWPAGITERRQFLLTHFASLARQLVFVGLDPASHRFLDFQRSERLDAFLRGTLAALGPAPPPEAMLQHVAGHAPEEIRGLLRRTVPADEFALFDPVEAGPRVFTLRLHKCACLDDKVEAGLELRVEGLNGLEATLDDLYDGLVRLLLLSPSARLMPRGVEPLLVVRYNQPGAEMAPPELLLARVPGSPRPYRWRASLSPGTMGVAQHLFDPSREGVETRLRDLGLFLPTTEVHACLWDGQTHGASHYRIYVRRWSLRDVLNNSPYDTHTCPPNRPRQAVLPQLVAALRAGARKPPRARPQDPLPPHRPAPGGTGPCHHAVARGSGHPRRRPAAVLGLGPRRHRPLPVPVSLSRGR